MALEEEKANKVEESDASMNEDSAEGSEEKANKVEESDVRMNGDSVEGSVSNKILNIEDNKNHRENIKYSSDYESDESTDDDFFKNLRKNVVVPPVKIPAPVKTKAESLPLDLPAVEDLNITENVTNLKKIGTVLHFVKNPGHTEVDLVVQTDGTVNPIDADSVLFLSSGEPLGIIQEVFGNVSTPNYRVRFNKPEDIENKGVTIGQDVYYSPSNEELTHVILVNKLKQHKGSDASWKDNNEPPDDQIDYSDDEQEKMARQKQRAKNRKNDRDSNSDEGDGAVAPKKIERKQDTYNQERAFQANRSRNRFPSPRPGPSRSYSSPRNFGGAPSPSPPRTFSPGTSGLQRNTPLSQPCRPASCEYFLPSAPSPQSFGSFDGPIPVQSFMVPTSPQPFGTFSQSSVPTYQSYPPPPPPHVFAPSNHASSYATGAPQQGPSSLMRPPQNNFPLQQQEQFLLQSQQPVGHFLSQPPPNYNTNQNSRAFGHQNHSFTPPAFGAPPASNQLFVNQLPYSPRNITSMNSNGHQGPSYGMVQSSVGNSFPFPPGNTQHNNIRTAVTQPVFGPSQSTLPPSSSPYVLCPTPPFPTQQGFHVVSNPHPPILPTQQDFHVFSTPRPPLLPCQTPPPTFHSYPLSVPVMRNQMPPQHYPHYPNS